jgi:hypothetical protein
VLAIVLALSSGLGSAYAQEATAEPPMAIPVGGQPPIASTTARAPAAPATAEDLKGAMSFRSGHLEIRSVTAWHGGGSWVIHEGYGWGRGPGPRWGVSTVVAAPMVPEHAWTVFQGPSRLTVPEYLDLVDDPRANDVRRRIRNNRSAAGALAAFGVAGVSAVITGAVGASSADFPAERHDWNVLANAGVGGVLIGFGGSALANGTARHLEYDYGEIGWERTRTQVDDYNEKLRTKLGVPADQAWRIMEEGGQGR